MAKNLHVPDRGHIPLGGKYEGVFVADAAVFKTGTVNRVEKSLGDLEVVVALDQLFIVLLGLRPEVVVAQVVAGDQLDKFHDLLDFLLVEIDTPSRGCMHTLPIGVFKAWPGRQGNVLVVGEIGLKTIENGLGKAS